MRIGVFDSGIGGEAIAKSLQTAFPDADIKTINDRDNLPYGSKSAVAIQQLTTAAITPLLGRDVIVIACNSATTAAIEFLRQKYPSQKFIGIEPMVKPAALSTITRSIAVCATPATLASKAYQKLKQTYASEIEVFEPDCSAWAEMIESNQINRSLLTSTLDQIIDKKADVIVLGCTHYHWIKELIEDYVGPNILVLEPSNAIARRVARLLAD